MRDRSVRTVPCIVTTGVPFFQSFPLRIGHVRTLLYRYSEVTTPNGQVNGRQRPKGTATPSTQCIYSSVSEASLQKTGVFLNSAGDFWEFPAQKVRLSVSRDNRR